MQFYSNFGFRRARLIQELFACTRYPAELTNMPQQLGPYLYSSPWPPDSVSNNSAGHQPVFIDSVRPRRLRDGAVQSGNTEYVDFRHDCQNCHSTLNHRAPMFGIGALPFIARRQARKDTPAVVRPWSAGSGCDNQPFCGTRRRNRSTLKRFLMVVPGGSS